MLHEMSILRVTITLTHLNRPAERVEVHGVMVDSGSEYTWMPRPVLQALGIEAQREQKFETADRRVLTREIGYAMLSTAGRNAPTIVVFAEPTDMTLIGAVTLEELALRIDLGRRELVPAGPLPVAAAA